MKLAEKIQHLRKKQGWSQEELSEKLMVSRQAVSKWESGQSVPDVDKIVVISQLFSVSTDYLLKEDATESMANEEPAEMPAGKTAFLLGSGMVAIGLLISLIGWWSYYTLIPIGIGLAVQIIGCVFFEVVLSQAPNVEMHKKFYAINVWLLMPIVVYAVTHLFFGWIVRSYNGFVFYIAASILYLLVCLCISYVLLKKKHR